MAETLHYRGDHRVYDPDLILGPDIDHRRLRIVGAEYDPATDVTTMTLKAVMPQEFRERVKPMVEQAEARQRIKELFTCES